MTSLAAASGIKRKKMWRLAILLLVAGCELRGLTRSQLYGSQGDAAPAADASLEAPDAAGELAPDVGADLDGRAAPPEGIIVTGFVSGTCHGEPAMVGGAGFHTCSYLGKGSYRLRIRNIPPGTRVELGARLPGYLPDPATAVITLAPDGNVQNFQLAPASGSCASVPDAGPCVCIPAEGCEPS
jgi:hypothetical protein